MIIIILLPCIILLQVQDALSNIDRNPQGFVWLSGSFTGF